MPEATTGRFGALRFQSELGRERVRLLDLATNMLGRGPSNDIVLDDPSVGHRHARLTIENGRLVVEDLGSGNGTFVDGHAIPPNTPTLVEDEQELRFGDVATRFDAPDASGPGGAAAAAGAAGATAGAARAGSREPEAPPELSAAIRVTMIPPAEPLMTGGPPGIARLQVSNTGRVVDQLSITVLDIPQEWVRINNPQLVLVPGEASEVSIAIQVPRGSDATAGTYEFSVVVTSAETSREVFASGTVELKPVFNTLLDIRPRRSRRRFELHIENHGNARVTYSVRGRDEDDLLAFEFESVSVALEPGETKRLPFNVIYKRRLFGKQEVHPFTITLTSTTDPSLTSQTAGQLVSRPPLQRLVFPAILLFVIAAAVAAALLFFFWPFGDDEPSEQDLLSLVHPMCDPDVEPDERGTPIVRTSEPDRAGDGPGAPVLYAQNDVSWGDDEYAKAKDPDFGPDWCGDTIAQCGCAMSSMANVMSVLALATMPDGTELTPRTLNDWLNLQAVRDSRGYVSQGYAYGNVLWMAANQLSGEMAREFGTPTIRFNGWGPGDDAFIRSELEAGRPVVLEIPGHFIAAYGIDQETGAILIYDPYYPDRTTIDYYHTRGVPIRGSRLFEPSDDLSGVMITSPRDVRIKVIRKDTGEEVGTLNTAPADEAAERARVEVEGAGYLTAPAWRDPTCTEREPPAEAGTNQIWLPGSIDDYIIEFLNTTDSVPTVAVHSYDEDGNVEILRIEGAPTGQIQEFDADPDGSGTPEPGETPDGTTTPGTGTPTTPGVTPQPTTPGGGPVGPSPTPVPGATTAAPTDGTPTNTPTATATATATTPAAPVISDLTCNTTYQEDPKQANVQCVGTVQGSSTSQTWAVNGTPTGVNGLVYNASFTSNTTITAQLTVCNGPTCVNQSRAVQIVFPTGGTPTATATATATPPGGVAAFPDLDVVCGVSDVPDAFSTINCTASFTDAFTSIQWSAPGTSNPSQTTGVKTYQTSVPNNSPLFVMAPSGVSAAQSPPPSIISHTFSVTANVCNGVNCRAMTEFVTVVPKYRVDLSWDLCRDSNPVWVEGEVNQAAPSSVIAQFEVSSLQFFRGGSSVGVVTPSNMDGNLVWWVLEQPPFSSDTFSASFAVQGNLAAATLPSRVIFDECDQ